VASSCCVLGQGTLLHLLHPTQVQWEAVRNMSIERRPKVERWYMPWTFVRQLTYSIGSGINVKRFDTRVKSAISNDYIYI